MKRKRPGEMLPVEEALRIVLDRTGRLPPEEVSLYQSLGGVLAADVPADRDYPPFTRSIMDGYAVRSADTPGTLEVIEEIRAGMMPSHAVGKGEASAIMTGAPVPEGADAVVPVEETEGEVTIKAQASPGQHMSVRGEAIREGEIAIDAGRPIRAEEIAVLASVGRDRVTIYRKPRVSIIATGDELVDISDSPAPQQIRNSNSYALWAQAWGMGIPVHLLGVVRDEKEEIRERIREALKDDCVLISGGVSMGEYDLVGDVLREMGMETAFDRVAVKPGKPTLFGTLRGKTVFGLPGNPVSGFVIFQLLVRPAIQKLMGVRDPGWSETEAILEDGHLTPISRRLYLPGIIRGDRVRPVPWKGSGDPFGPSRGNCLVQVPIGSPPLGPGDTVRVLHGQTGG